MYGAILTYYGAAIYVNTKSIRVTNDSSMKNEGYGTQKVADIVEYAQAILTANGHPPNGPTFIGTDNLANALVCNDESSAGRCKHTLRRYTIVQDRIRKRDIDVGHIKDEENPSDFLTKWQPRKKMRLSVKYATGQDR